MPVQIASASAIAVLLAGLYAPVQTGETPLFTRCAKVNLRVDAPTGLEEDVIRSMTESRLREAGLFRIPNLNGAINYMSRVGITVTHDGALLIVAFSKSGDEMTSLRMSWESITFDDEDMRETLAMIIDNFVVEYQRANESACERRENQR